MKGSFAKLFHALLTLLFLLLTTFSWATRGTEIEVKCIERERQALLIFQKGILEDNHGTLSTWKDHENGDCCNWNGVRCSNETGHVQILCLRGSYSQYLRGTINFTSLIELHDLKHLDLSFNDFYSSNIPEFIDSFINLRYFNLSYSSFDGSIPYQLGKLSQLRYLDLSDNNLDGAIPHQLGNLSKLQYLNLGWNSLVGAIPYQLGNLSKLQYLNLGWNSLVGAIPHQLGNLSKLQYLNLGGNSLVGAIPHQLGNLSKLQYLNLEGNSLVGVIPYQLGNLSMLHSLMLGGYHSNLTMDDAQWLSKLYSLTNLRELSLIKCNISLTNSLLNFSTSLAILDLSYNSLTMSTWTMNFSSNLQELSLSNCSLSSHDLILISSSSNLSSLAILDLSYNLLTSSTLFHWIFNFISNLHKLVLNDNKLKSPIPDEFGNKMKSLEYLDLSFNELQGEIPMSLGNICTLQNLDLSYNNLSGDLTSFIQNLSRCNRHPLRTLYLSENRITGMLPNLTILSSLKDLYLSNNQLVGEIPESIGLLYELQYLYLDDNFLKGLITESHFRNLSNLKLLSISDNSLSLKFSTGWVPPFQLEYLLLASCKIGPLFPNWLQNQNQLQELDISNSGISGVVPEWFWEKFENIFFVNISYNNFIGEIPNLMLNLKYGPEIIMTSNNFEGSIPSFFAQSSALYFSKNKFSNLDALSCGKTKVETLGILDVSSNQLKGQLPDCWSQLNSLVFLDLSNNNLSGEVPPSLGNIVNLEALVLRNNSLNGELPKFLKNCTRLILLDMSENKLVGPLPLWIGESLHQLQILSLRVNHFSGSIPLHLCHLTQIQILDLSQNNLSNEIPPCFKNFTIIAQESINFTNIGYHRYFYNTTRTHSSLSFFFYIILMWKGVNDLFEKPEFLLKSIDLSSNALTGEIPKELVSLFGLVSLNLSRNNLHGKIPSEIGNLQSLEFLDLSRNQLSGTIPPSCSY